MTLETAWGRFGGTDKRPEKGEQMDVKKAGCSVTGMDSVVGEKVGAEKVICIAQVDQRIVLNSCPREDDPGDEPKAQQRQDKFISFIDQAIVSPEIIWARNSNGFGEKPHS